MLPKIQIVQNQRFEIMTFNEIKQNYHLSTNTLVTKVFVIASPFHPSILFVGKGRANP
jgi:hypothetical protein